MTTPAAPAGPNGKIGILIEEHFDPFEFRDFNRYFPSQGYEVVYLTHLWGQPALHFGSNPEENVVKERVTVTTEVRDLDLSGYRGIIAIGAYATTACATRRNQEGADE